MDQNSQLLNPIDLEKSKKANTKYLMLIFLLGLIVLGEITFLAYHIYFKEEKKEQVLSLQQAYELPTTLMIPSINVNASIEDIALTEAGDLDVPSNSINVGWYALGPRPGENGSSVIDGHVDGKDGNPGVFSNLHKLKKGDELYIKDSKGKLITFIVRESQIYDTDYATEVFTPSDKPYLNLITCDGSWNEITKSYSKRLVVFTDIKH